MESKELPTDQATEAAIEEKKAVDGAEGVSEESSMLPTNKGISDKEPDAKDETSEDTEITLAESENKNGTANIEVSVPDSVIGDDNVKQTADPNATVDPKPDTETAEEEPRYHLQNATAKAQEDSEVTREESIDESSEKVDAEKLFLAKEEPIEESSKVTREESLEKVDANPSSETMPSDIVDAETEENSIPSKPEDEVDNVEAALSSERVNDADTETVKEAITDSVPETAEAQEDSKATKAESIEESSVKVDAPDSQEDSEQRAVTDSVSETETKLAEPEAASEYTTSHANPSSETTPKLEDEVDKVAASVKSERVNDTDTETVKEATTEVSESADASVITEVSESSDASIITAAIAEGVEELHDSKCNTKETKQESSKDEQDAILTETDKARAVEASPNENSEDDIVAEIRKAPGAIGEAPKLHSEAVDTSALVAEASSEDVITEAAAGISEVPSKEKKTLKGFLLAEKANTDNLESIKLFSANNSDVAPVTEVGPQEETVSGGVEDVVEDAKAEEEEYSENTELPDAEKDDSLDLPHTDKEVKEEPASESKEAENNQEAKEEHTEKTGRDLNQEVPKPHDSAKPSSRPSNNIFLKVKHSISKVKKVITGKSPGSKTSAAENKD